MSTRVPVSPGKLITLEGIEGAGKSTLAQFMSAWLGRHGITVRLTREPGGTPLAERVRQIVLERGAEPVSPLVAPRTLSVRSSRSSTCSKRLPRSCIAMSLNASVGPLESARTCRLDSSVRSGVISGVPNASRV